jgi:lysophospholipase L1-like esterase
MRRAYAAMSLIAAFALLSGPAMAKKPAVKKNLPVVPGSQYLALGDSVTFGYMESNVVPAPNYSNAASFLGYPEQLGAELHLRVTNAACPGETSASLISVAAQSNGCENNPSGTSANYRVLHPLHVRYKGSQLAYAVSYLKSHHDVRLVSLMIGANDYLRCVETTKDACASSSEEAALAATLTKNVRTILSTIRNKAHYQGQIALVNYYSPFAALNATTVHYNGVGDATAKPFHVEVVDGYGLFAAADAHSGGDACKAGLVTQLSTGKCGIHPSYAGSALLAQAVAKAIKLG